MTSELEYDKWIDEMTAENNALRAERDGYEALKEHHYKHHLIEDRAMLSSALQDILTERLRQDEKWGEQNHNPYIYLAILQEEVGEYAQAVLHSQFGGDSDKDQGGFENVRKEAVQVAAVALAMVECLDRGKWKQSDVKLSHLKGSRPKNGSPKSSNNASRP